jgi:hypothetical protein
LEFVELSSVRRRSRLIAYGHASYCISSKKGTCLRVDTIGEQFNDMTVTRWTRENPEAPH